MIQSSEKPKRLVLKYKPRSLTNDSCRFTDDTVHTIAVAEALLIDMNFAELIRSWSLKYPDAGYGGMMRKWILDKSMGPYNSYGNGSAMRVSPCAWVHDDPIGVAIKSASITHNHPEGIKGAEVVTKCIGVCSYDKLLEEEKKDELVKLIKEYYPDYDLSESIEERRKYYSFDSTCEGSVPQSIQCVIESDSYSDTIKTAISMGGDADTMACIAGSIAGCIWDKPQYLIDFAYSKLPEDMIKIIEEFDKYIHQSN